MSAQTRVAEFATGSGAGVFPAIARADVVTGLRERVADPTSQDTSHVNLCGPAALLYCVLNDNPDLYVQYVVDLYTPAGHGWARSTSGRETTAATAVRTPAR